MKDFGLRLAAAAAHRTSETRARSVNNLTIALLIGALGGLAIGLKKWREEKEARHEDHPPAKNSDHKHKRMKGPQWYCSSADAIYSVGCLSI